jgi:hypothetical protein
LAAEEEVISAMVECGVGRTLILAWHWSGWRRRAGAQRGVGLNTEDLAKWRIPFEE